MTTDLSVRRATGDDARLLAELGELTFSETFAHLNTPEDMEAYTSAVFTPARLAEELADPRSAFWVAEAGGEPAGYAKLQASEPPPCVAGERPVELVRLYVLRRWHGLGAAKALMRACVEEAHRWGHRTMWLGVWEHNARAQAFYRKWGFRHVGEHVFQLGSDPQTDWLMEGDLEMMNAER
ncbi:MAG TPA: GNAT family N-acetyltransferase [Pyrinomonadaceae bacterium]|nr:GNAT family N-acetyltransferase [Pyrinomonadaceae bacterium]